MRQKKAKNRVGLTAFYTASVWSSLKVSGAGRFVTWRGRLLHAVVSLGGAAVGLYGRYSVTSLYLAGRHRGLDCLLETLNPVQVVELAAGLSSRGWEMTRHKSVHYIELDQLQVLSFKHHVTAADPQPLAPSAEYQTLTFDLSQPERLPTELQAYLQPDKPTLIISEGLTGYLPEAALTRLMLALRDLAECQPNTTILLDFALKLNRADHKRAYFGMLPGQLVWQLVGAPPRLFLRDKAHLESWLAGLGFEVKRLYSSQELARLAGLTPPAVVVYYLAELQVRSPGVL